MYRRTFGILAIATACLLVASPVRTYLSEWLAVDRCLDSGGSFDYASMQCDQAKNHPFVPFEARHPRLFQTLRVRFVIAGPLLLVGLAVMARSRRSQVAVV
jgi:hypothetical protein